MNVDQIIREVDGSMAIEGMPLSQEEKERIRECLMENTSFEEMKRKIIEKYTIKV